MSDGRADSRSVSVHLDGVDAVLGEAAALQEGAVVADLHTLTGEVTGLEQLDAVVLSVLPDRDGGRSLTDTRHELHMFNTTDTQNRHTHQHSVFSLEASRSQS